MRTLLLCLVAIALVLGGCSDDPAAPDDGLGGGSEWGAGTTDRWDGSADISWFDPTLKLFYLKSAEQLAGFSQLVGAGTDFSEMTVMLDVNVELNPKVEVNERMEVTNAASLKQWDPIGTEEHPFFGVFDGQNHTVSGLYTDGSQPYGGLFGCAGLLNDDSFEWDRNRETVKCVIRNIGVTRSYIKGARYAGAIAGQLASGIIYNDAYHHNVCRGEMSNCWSDATVTTDSEDSCAGGIVGVCSGSIRYCRNGGTVKGFYTGGISGRADEARGGECAVITECYNEGEVTCVGEKDSGASAAGIVGCVSVYDRNDKVIENCYNSAQVSLSGETEGCNIAGICVYNAGSLEGLSLSNCYNIGTVKGSKIIAPYYPDADCYYLAENRSGSTYGAKAYFRDNGGVLIPTGDGAIIGGALTLIDALNAHSPGVWKIEPGKNGGYPVLTGNSIP